MACCFSIGYRYSKRYYYINQQRQRYSLFKTLSIVSGNHTSINIHIKKMSSINSSNKYDDTERKFGISSYTSTHEGFAAVVKGRYSDFVVHEGTSSICAYDVCKCI